MAYGCDKNSSPSFNFKEMHTHVRSTRFRLDVLCSSAAEMIRFPRENPYRENTIYPWTVKVSLTRAMWWWRHRFQRWIRLTLPSQFIALEFSISTVLVFWHYLHSRMTALALSTSYFAKCIVPRAGWDTTIPFTAACISFSSDIHKYVRVDEARYTVRSQFASVASRFLIVSVLREMYARVVICVPTGTHYSATGTPRYDNLTSVL